MMKVAPFHWWFVQHNGNVTVIDSHSIVSHLHDEVVCNFFIIIKLRIIVVDMQTCGFLVSWLGAFFSSLGDGMHSHSMFLLFIIIYYLNDINISYLCMLLLLLNRILQLIYCNITIITKIVWWLRMLFLKIIMSKKIFPKALLHNNNTISFVAPSTLEVSCHYYCVLIPLLVYFACLV